MTSRLDLQNIGKQCTFRKENYHCCWSMELDGVYPNISLQERINECKGCLTFQEHFTYLKNPSERQCSCSVCKLLRAKGIKVESK